MAGQGPRLDQPLWQCGQDGVAVLLFLHPQSRVEMEGHLQPLGQPVRLVHAPGARPPDVHLLQGHDIRRLGCDHVGDTGDVQPPVIADAAMHIVGQDAWHGSP